MKSFNYADIIKNIKYFWSNNRSKCRVHKNPLLKNTAFNMPINLSMFQKNNILLSFMNIERYRFKYIFPDICEFQNVGKYQKIEPRVKYYMNL